MAHAINWFEIPVTDMERAVRFYSTLLGVELKADPAGDGYVMCVFPNLDGVSGALVLGEGYVPGSSGALIYLNCSPSLDAALERAASAGAQIVTPKTDTGEHGAFAFILDSEGNRIALHQLPER